MQYNRKGKVFQPCPHPINHLWKNEMLFINPKNIINLIHIAIELQF
jgi:hypothetical protein